MAPPTKKRKSSTSEVNSFELLPPEIQEVVFGNLPFTDKTTCRSVCKDWKYLVENPFLKFSFRLCTYSLQWFRRLTVPLYSLAINDVDFQDSFTWEDKCALQTVKHMSFSPNRIGFNYETFKRILQHSDNVVKLNFESYLFMSMIVNIPNLAVPETIHLENLRKMVIRISDYDHVDNFLAVFSLNTPSLEELETMRIFACACCGPYYGRDVLIAYMQFIAKNKKTLKTFKATNTLVASTTPSDREQDEPIIQADHSELLSELAEVNLTSMQVRHITNDSRGEDWEFASKLINNQKALEILQTDLQPSTTAVNFTKLLSQNVLTLRTVHITHSRMQKIDFDCAWISEMKCLEDFGIMSRWKVPNVNQLPATIETLFWGAPLSCEQILSTGQNLTNLKVLSLRDNFVQSMDDENDDFIEENIDLAIFREIVSFSKLNTVVASDSEFGDHLVDIHNYCAEYEGLEFIQTECRHVMSQLYFELTCTVKIRRD